MPYKDPEVRNRKAREKRQNRTQEQIDAKREYYKQYRASKKEERKQYMAERYAKMKGELIERLGAKCACCDSTEDLQFDHIDRHNKSGTVTKILSSKGFDAAVIEADKCQLLCNQCHKAKTNIYHDNMSLFNGMKISKVDIQEHGDIIVTLSPVR